MKSIISFKIVELPELGFRAFAVDGKEGLSELYQFDVDCFGDAGDRPDELDLVGKRAVLRFELEGADPREVYGVIKTVICGAPSAYGDVRYRFRLVPWLERLNYSHANQIHGTDKEVSVADVIEAELRGGLRRETRVEDTDFRIFEHELRLKDRSAYPKRDHLVQYDETDFAFISRLAEHHGIFYFFENANGIEKVIFADDNFFTKPIDGDETLDWKPWGAGARAAAPDTIQEFVSSSRMIPRRMWMLDYNYRLPHVPLLTAAEIDNRGRGHWVEYGSHHRTTAEGETLARIRAEEMRSHQRRWTGKSAVARLSPGRSFMLNGHPYEDWNQEYLVVSVHHEVRVPMPGLADTPDWVGYRNSFEAIPQKTAFRPARVTPKPRMDGLLNARIDGVGERDKAEIDDQGRYRVRVPFDNAGTPDGKGSQWVRMASPFGGDGDGMHFPLAPDTEVVVACVNGDPNRPIILGAVPNPRNKSVVTQENSLRNRVVTRTGMGLEMAADGGGSAGSTGGGASNNNGLATQSAYGLVPFLQAPNAFGSAPKPEEDASAAPDLAFEAPSALMAVEDTTSANYVRVYNTLSSSYLRLGAVPASGEENDIKKPGALGKAASAASTNADKEPNFVLGAARTDAVFDEQQGAYLRGSSKVFVKSNGDMGLVAGNEFILTSGGAASMASAGQIRLQATGDFESVSSANIRILANGVVNIESKGNLNINAKGDLNFHSTGNLDISSDSPTTQTNRRTVFTQNYDKTTTYNWDAKTEVTGSSLTDVVLGIKFEMVIGNHFELDLLTKIEIVAAISLEVKGGVSLTINKGYHYEMGPAATAITATEIKTNAVDLKNRAVTAASDGLAAASTRLSAAQVSMSARMTSISASMGNFAASIRTALHL